MKSMFNQNEEALLGEIDRFASYCIENGKHADIMLTTVQYKLFKTLCNRASESKMVDRMNRIRNLDTERETYKKFQIMPIQTSRRHTKKDLGRLFE